MEIEDRIAETEEKLKVAQDEMADYYSGRADDRVILKEASVSKAAELLDGFRRGRSKALAEKLRDIRLVYHDKTKLEVARMRKEIADERRAAMKGWDAETNRAMGKLKTTITRLVMERARYEKDLKMGQKHIPEAS